LPPRVLIVDDSVVARAVLSRLIDASDRFMVAGAVGSVAAALDFLGRTRVDILLLDVNMPGVDGLTALPQLIAAGRGARIVVVSSSVGDGAAATVQALAMGAADTLVKPDTAALTSAFGRTLLDRLDRLIDRSPAGTGIVMEPAASPSRKSVAPRPACPRRSRRTVRSIWSRSAPRPAASMRWASYSAACPRPSARRCW